MTDFYKKKLEYLSDYKCDQTVIINKKFLKEIDGVRIKENDEFIEKHIDWFPFVNSYYPYTEDVDIYSRVNHLLSTNPSFCALSHMQQCDDCTCVNDGYSEKEAQIQYLSMRPTSFLILGKPGTGTEQLGKLLAKYWKCVYIDPETLIREEIAGETTAGKCIRYNLKVGRAIGVDTLLNLVEKRVNSKSAEHRGFVICGFPLISNNFFKKESITTESAMLNVQQVCDEILETATNICIPPKVSSYEDEFLSVFNEEQGGEGFGFVEKEKWSIPVDLGSEKGSMCAFGVYEENYEEQMRFIFEQFKKPYVIIYVVCNNIDVVTKHERCQFDIISEQFVDLQVEEADKMAYTHFSQLADLSNCELPEDFIDMFKNTSMLTNEVESRQLITFPKNIPANVTTVLSCYRERVLPIIERYVLRHDPQNVIRVDGRISPARMFSAIKQRLEVLPLQRVIVPEGIESAFGEMSLEDCFLSLSKTNIASSLFKWTLSDWGFKCPVSLKEGIEQDGDPNLAVRFMNKIYFLSCLESYVQFVYNPRPFLLPPNPQLQCKICVMGPRCSGKIVVAKCLAYIFSCDVFSYETMLEDYTSHLEGQLRKTALEDALRLLNEIRLKEWKESEDFKKSKRVEWIDQQRTNMVTLIKIKKAIKKYTDGLVLLELSSFPVQLSYREDRESLDDLPIGRLQEMLEESLKETDIPELPFISDYEELLANDFKMQIYFPEGLKVNEEPTPALPTDEFVINYVNDILQHPDYKNVQLTVAQKIDVLLDGMKKLKEGKWIVDGIHPAQELFDTLYPDKTPTEVIILKDSTSGGCFFNDSYDFKDFFKKMCDTNATNIKELDGATNISEEAYIKEMNEFNEKFEKIRPSLEEHKVRIIELDMADKSLEALLKHLMRLIKSRYRQQASVVTEYDRAQELEDFGEPDVHPEDTSEREDDVFLENRRFGDTYIYCPVAFHDHYVLWKGKNEFTVKFDDKVYLLSSNEAMNNFIDLPQHYLLGNKPPISFPPPRICVVGPYGCGKATVAKSLSHNLGVYNFKYEDFLKGCIAPCSKLSFHEIIKWELGNQFTLIVKGYLLRDEVLEEEFLQEIVGSLWFGDDEIMHGFVLNGFPRRPSDIAFMKKYFAIPDVIVELTMNQGEVRNRLEKKILTEFEGVDMCERREQIYRELIDSWKDKYEIRFIELLNQKRKERLRATGLSQLDEFTETNEDEEEETDMIDEITAMLRDELPQPELELEDTDEEFVQNYINEFEQKSADELTFLQKLREEAETELIPWITVDAGVDEEKVFAQVMMVVETFKFRNESLFERVYEISVDLSEKLLSFGYYFLSKFGKTCPVQIYEDVNPIQMYVPSKEQFQLYPVIHRQYIYFLAQKESLVKFKKNPLKYVKQKYVYNPLIPLKVAIVGPPKCGKSSLAKRFKRDLGLQVVSRGKSCRYALQYLSCFEVAKKMVPLLSVGQCLMDEMVIKAVEASTFDGRCITQGFVLDGFPESEEEVRQLASVGLMPHVIIDLHAEVPIIHEFLASVSTRTQIPTYSQRFIDYRYRNFTYCVKFFRPWIEKEYQIGAKLVVTPCEWGMWNKSLQFASTALFEVKHYHRYVFNNYALRLCYMHVTPLEFLERQSLYKQYCPVCLLFENVLENGGEPPDRTGVVQFQYHFYYLCNRHMQLFIDDPLRFISPYNRRRLPHDLPKRVKKASLSAKDTYEDGYCVVCFWKNRPKYVLNRGRSCLAVLYKERVYFFDCLCCLREFLREPHLYFSIKINYKNHNRQELTVQDLPMQGYLQQNDVQQLIKAINNTGILRPIVPGLGPTISAVLNVGLYLKVNNPSTPSKYLPLYLDQMKATINPYLYYDEPMSKFKDPLLVDPEDSENFEIHT
ncbi:hypothetical protein FQA39_LY10070 [Lamprigera yunnana]|nr:hypothetical protein FQA39_LY10070 [Lamprigera yunnana]